MQNAQRLGANELTFLNVIEPGASADRIPQIEAAAAALREQVTEESGTALGNGGGVGPSSMVSQHN